MASRNRKAAYLYEVQTADAGAFAEALRETLAPRTAAGYCNLIRSAMARFLPAGTANPFAAMIGRQTVADGGGSVHRVPFTPEELTAILAGAREYDGGTLFGPIVAAACTALRRGDACRLDWSSVDLAAGLVAVRTSKTGERVELPLLAPLREVLEGVKEPRKGPCFPSAARMLADNPDGLTWRFKAIVAAAMTEAGEPPPDTAAVESAGLAAIARLPPGARRDRTAEAFRLYIAGASQNQIADKMGVCKGSVSGWLSFVAGQIGQPVIRDAGPNVRAGIIKHTQAAREIGQRAASLRDWHALRTTFVTLALSANVPIELVRRVTGHRTVEVVLANYFRPGREAFRVALTGSLPNVLTGGDATPTPAAELQTLAAKVGAGTATKEDKRRLRLLAAKI
jgi:integrase